MIERLMRLAPRYTITISVDRNSDGTIAGVVLATPDSLRSGVAWAVSEEEALALAVSIAAQKADALSTHK